jgi:hypothetical protein
MTTDAAIKKLEAEADYHRSQGRWDVGHEYQRYANELGRLASIATSLPKRPKPKVAYKRNLRAGKP